jgi:signal transduction histidine kinase
MPGGGVAEAGTENVEITEEQARNNPDGPAAGRYVRLSITDHGHGMTPEVQAQACEPFFTTKDDTKGAGLGLATVHDIVRRAGGSLSFDSSPDQGTTVSALFPASDLPARHHDGTGEAPTDSDSQSTPLQRTRLASAIREVIERSATPRSS